MMAREIYKELEYGLKQPQSLGSCVWETPVPGHPSFGKQDRVLHKIKIRSLFCAGAVAEDGPRLCMWQGRLSLWDHLQGCPGAECLVLALVCTQVQTVCMQSLPRAQVQVPPCSYSLCAGAECRCVGSGLRTGAVPVPSLAWGQVPVMFPCHLALPSLAIWVGVLQWEQNL